MSGGSSVLLQRLHSIPGNNVCVDCKEPGPTWVSINLGVMMCITCSGFHRNLGVHISQVRSADLDGGWEEELLNFLSSVGNRAFNRVWEAQVTASGAIRPQEYPSRGFIRQQFIIRKYQHKLFLKYDLGMTATPNLKSKPIAHTTYQSLTEVQSSALPTQPLDPSDILKAGSLQKLGGRETALFHTWQTRFLIITHDGRIYYAKDMSEAPVGVIPLQLSPTFEDEGRNDNYYYFGIPTLPDSEPKGRKFLFRCENETSRLEFIEAIRRVLPSRALAETADSQSVEEDFGTSVTTGLEDTIDLLTRGFYRWYLDALSPQPSSAPLVSETSESLEQLPLPLVLSASSSQIASSPPPAPAPISSTPLLYPPLKIVKEAVFLYRSIGSASWVPRYCVLTNEAFYISSYTSSPTNPECIPPSTGAHLRRTSVTLQPPVIVVPLTVAKVDKNLPNYSSEPNGPEVAFAVWCPLSYGLLGCDARTKEEWIRIIAEAMEEAKQKKSEG